MHSHEFHSLFHMWLIICFYIALEEQYYPRNRELLSDETGLWRTYHNIATFILPHNAVALTSARECKSGVWHKHRLGKDPNGLVEILNITYKK